ncbi:DinB family protein [Paucihalobacter sp.]|uniref:DinB family protein n=1 Tax=Paucihalobacter sp. TaxID=2850405 RepID=UPI003D160A2B
MKHHSENNNRRNFLKNSSLLTFGLVSFPLVGFANELPSQTEDDLYIIGPRDGYDPQVGTLLSTMNMMRAWVIDSVKDLTVEQLDFQIDKKSNSIGAMLLHLAATEKYYQLHTFDDLEWGTWSEDIKAKWDVPSGMGKLGREQILGNDVGYYLNKLEEVREVTKKEFAKRGDKWLMEIDRDWPWGPTNNYCKWFHVCEHESNHRGQMKFIAQRLPA